MAVIKVEITAGGDAFVQETIAGVAGLWITFDVYFESGLPAAASGDFSAQYAYTDGGGGSAGGVTSKGEAGGPELLTYWSSGGVASVTIGQWYTVDYYVESTNPVDEELWVDGVDQMIVDGPFDNSFGNFTSVYFGAKFAGGWETNTVFYLRNLKVGTSRGAGDIFAPDLSSGTLNSLFDSVSEDAGSTISLVAGPTPPGATTRVMDKRWRYLLADLDGTPISFYDVQARQRQIEFELNGVTSITGVIDSNNPQANLTHTDGFPYLSEGDRLLYAFRRDYDGGGSTYPWTCRAAGTIMEVTDDGGVDNADTRFAAFDPWQYLMSLPVVGPSLDGTDDVTIIDTLDQIVVTLIQDAHNTYSFANPAKTGIDLTGGTIETLPLVTMTFQRETMIGQCLQQCAAMGCDIVLTPVYDPTRPGVLCDLNVYAFAGDLRPDATFAWDKGRRSVVNDNREIDGTQRQNNVRYHLRAQTDGSEATVTETEPASITRFGDYWGTRYWPAEEQVDTIQEAAAQTLSEFSENKRTVSLGPVPERSPDPFTEWYLGDFVKVFASKKLRATQSGYQRVTGFTVEISDNALETIRDLRVYIPLEPAS